MSPGIESTRPGVRHLDPPASGAAGPEHFGSGQWEILERIARGASLSELLHSIVRLVERQAEDMLCSILLIDGNGRQLRPGAALRLPRELQRFIDGMPIGPSAGSCGAAAFRRERIIVTDIETHPYWVEYRQPFMAHGLLACWSSPLLSPSGELLGTLAMYFREKRGPTLEERAWVDAATHLSEIALTRAEAERERERLLHDLGERVKELTVLHKAARLLQADHRDPSEQLTEIVRLVPSGWQHPDICEARIAWHDVDVRTPGFRDTPWRQVATASAGEHSVRIEVIYSSPAPSAAEGPFLAEERTLIQSLADLMAAHLERHRAEQALVGTLSELRDANQRLTFHVSRMPLAYIVWDHDFVVTEWNAAAERIFGWAAHEAIGRRADELMVLAGPRPASDLLRDEVLESEASGARGTHENVRKDGQRRVCEWFHAPLRDAAGMVAGYLSMANDVTERKLAEEERARLEAQLRGAQRIQSLGTLAGGIAHDFNNILTAITGHAHLALTDLEEERSTKDSLLAIQEAGLRAVELVRRILTFARHQAPERKLGPLGPVVEEALRLLRSTVPSQIAIHTHFDPSAPMVNVDPAQVQQVIMNLGANAAYAIGERGSIDVTIEPIPPQHAELASITDAPSTGYVRLTFSDTGRGMDDATRERIFEPFFTTKPTGQGTGLGLSVVHGIVKSHDGVISVQSKPGQGSVFQIYFPQVESPADDGTLAPPKATRLGQGVRVLYVDDEEPLVVLATRWLGRLGHHVTGFSDSTLALEAFRAHPFDFDAVISDVAMPGLSGLELVREIVAIRPDIVVVMSSGYLRPEEQRLARELGAADVVLKPQSMAEFGPILHRILNEQKRPPVSS
jgi:PAS domain S-box-containing protein